eukprot:CAMPEP_0171199266 /NCGR_PEP_ID=MMETSP0790-20130122/23376_1 /TAXON_ID=2925 /ORGANISM="Alexandrium catenella, Strain OF101" /LENGTH=45 /DNA_ID= /DNA_START= /DNA_END= /DNA_ORIENTATION=
MRQPHGLGARNEGIRRSALGLGRGLRGHGGARAAAQEYIMPDSRP